MVLHSLIYKIQCKNKDNNQIYIGSTSNIQRRIYCHKSSCKSITGKKYNLKIYKYIRDNGGWDSFEFVILEAKNFETKYNLHLQERFWIEQLQSTLNIQLPTRNSREYYQKNRIQINIKKRKYHFLNKEKLNKLNNIYYQKNKEKISENNNKRILCPHCKKIYNNSYIKIHIKTIHKII